MKTKLLILTLISFIFYNSVSQIPAGFNYQAVARNSAGDPIVNTAMPVRITIQADSAGSSIIWQELHSSVVTSSLGTINIVPGKGARQSGSAASFQEIDWNISPKFIKTEINFNGWITLGVARLWSVPYAMVAGEIEGSIKKLTVAGKPTLNDEALFEVRNKDGNTVFAVYNEGVRVYVAEGGKGIKSGFAVGGFGTDKAESQKYFVVSKDSIRIYLDTDTTTKKLKGGFAVGGYDMTKGSIVEDYLQVSRDSTRIYVNDSPVKRLKGGFAVGGFDMTKGNQNFTPFTSLTHDNYFIGHEAGLDNTTGKYNSFFGYKAGRSNTSGDYNIFIGHYSGISNKDGWANLFIGDSAGYENTSGYYNVAMGAWAGQWNKTGRFNVSIGANAGLKNETGNQNVNIGMQAGAFNLSGSFNTLIGSGAGEKATAGSANVFLGNLAGFDVISGDGNVYAGSFSGKNNLTGSWNVFLGYGAGRDETNSNRLYIANNATPSPLIYGEFENGMVVINGNAGHNLGGHNLFVNGTAGGNSAWFNYSDMRMKNNIVTIPHALNKVLRLRGVIFHWNDPVAGMEGPQIGFIGQEAIEVIPEVVSMKQDHYSMQYAPVTALLVEAMKEQQKIIDSQQAEIEKLRLLEKEVSELKAAVCRLLGSDMSARE